MMKQIVILTMVLGLGLLLGCEEIKETKQAEEAVMTDIIVTSETLNSKGQWLSAINAAKANPAGTNTSPQLDFTSVEGAGVYAVYMVDTSAGNWLHWKVEDLQATTLAAGEEIANSKYIGPYPPSGTHTYEIWVYALKTSPDEYPGKFDSANLSMEDMEKVLNAAGGQEQNIIGKGSISGTVERKILVEQ